MSYLTTEPGIIAAAAADVDQIGSALHAAHTAVAGPTSGLAAAAGDEVSTAIAKLFGEYGQAYQAVIPQVARFHSEFTQTMAAAAAAYSNAEITASNTLGGAPATAVPLTPTNVTAIVIGGTGNSIPSPDLVAGLLKYVPAHQYNVQSTIPLVTPEQLYPLTGVKSLPLTTSVSQGVQILNDELFGPQGQITLGNNVVVVAISQSAMISSLEMRNILALPPAMQPTGTQLGFVLMGDPMNPNGGLFARFPDHLTIPSLGLDFYGATPSNTQWPTSIYTLEYDGFADFPQYPLNVLADVNALTGIIFVHTTYASVNPNMLPSDMSLVPLHTPPTYTGNTDYYMITEPNIPLLDPLKAIPVVGQPLVDLLNPSLTTLVNLGYGDPNYGYSTSDPSVQMTFGLFHPVNPGAVAADLVADVQQGVNAFTSDVTAPGFLSPPHLSLPTLPPLPSLGPGSIDAFIDALKAANTNITNAVSSAASTAYGTLLPTADVINSLVTSIPSYDLNLFLDGIQQVLDGDPAGLINAIGLPIAADTALLVIEGGFEGLILASAAASIIKDFTGLIP